MVTDKSFEGLLITHCAPTLAGIKEGSMFNYAYERQNLWKETCDFWKEKLNSIGLGLDILKDSGKKALVYVYWKERLEKLVTVPEVREVLGQCGYKGTGSKRALEVLKRRIKEADCFPHEIGIFLGYPLEDVVGFIENQGKNCAFCGYWKVYCNKRQAEQTFELYTRCRDLYQKLFAKGISLLQMISV